MHSCILVSSSLGQFLTSSYMDYVIFLAFAVEYFYVVFSTVNSPVNAH
jgi:hypothetical protein